MSATKTTVTNAQVAVKYRQNVSSLSIYMDNLSWSTYRPILNRYVAWYVNRHISDDILAECRPICQPTCRLIHWSSVGWYVDWYIGRGVHKIHMIREIFWPQWESTPRPPDKIYMYRYSADWATPFVFIVLRSTTFICIKKGFLWLILGFYVNISL